MHARAPELIPERAAASCGVLTTRHDDGIEAPGPSESLAARPTTADNTEVSIAHRLAGYERAAESVEYAPSLSLPSALVSLPSLPSLLSVAPAAAAAADLVSAAARAAAASCC